MESKIITYDEAMRIVMNGNYYPFTGNSKSFLSFLSKISKSADNNTKILNCDYCMVSNLTGSWKLEETDNIDLCMNCFVKLRNNVGLGQKSLPIDGIMSIPTHESRISSVNIDLNSITFMMQDSIRRPLDLNSMTYMMQDSIRRPLTRMIQDSVRVQTKMKQDSVREPYALTKMKEDTVRRPQTNISCYRKNDGKFSFIDY